MCVYIYIYTYVCICIYIYIHIDTCWRQTPRSPAPKNTPKQYRILVIRGGMKTLAVRRDFDCCFVGSRV